METVGKPSPQKGLDKQHAVQQSLAPKRKRAPTDEEIHRAGEEAFEEIAKQLEKEPYV